MGGGWNGGEWWGRDGGGGVGWCWGDRGRAMAARKLLLLLVNACTVTLVITVLTIIATTITAGTTVTTLNPKP